MGIFRNLNKIFDAEESLKAEKVRLESKLKKKKSILELRNQNKTLKEQIEKVESELKKVDPDGNR